MTKADDPMRRCPCQAVRDRCDANGEMALFDLGEIVTDEERQALEAKRIADEMFRLEDEATTPRGPVAVGRPRENTAPRPEMPL